jgi:hypothetical protein
VAPSFLFAISENTFETARGTMPRSTYRSAPPVMVNVFPEPVCPYAKTVPLNPSNAPVTILDATRSNTSS